MTYQEVENRLQRWAGRFLRILDSCCNARRGRHLAECRRQLELRRLYLGFARMKEGVLDDPEIEMRIWYFRMKFLPDENPRNCESC